MRRSTDFQIQAALCLASDGTLASVRFCEVNRQSTGELQPRFEKQSNLRKVYRGKQEVGCVLSFRRKTRLEPKDLETGDSGGFVKFPSGPLASDRQERNKLGQPP